MLVQTSGRTKGTSSSRAAGFSRGFIETSPTRNVGECDGSNEKSNLKGRKHGGKVRQTVELKKEGEECESKNKRRNKFHQALSLPTFININPRSIYNKVNEFHTFVNEESVDLIFMSESFEREELTLKDIIKLEDHQVISNVFQRKGMGGRPAIIVNRIKYDIQDLTNTQVHIPWGVEAVWAMLTPKNVSHNSKIQKIACCSIYSKPNSKKKSLLLDHISETFNILNKKYGRGLHFIIAGDTNDLKLDSILSLSPNLNQIVKDWTRMTPPAILDPVITTLANFYQIPECLDPLDSDPDKNGKPSDHKIVLVKPISIINNISARTFRKIKVRPFTKSGMEMLKNWFVDQTWTEVFEEVSAHEKAKVFQNMLLRALDKYLPEKYRTISSDDQAWMTSKLKKNGQKKKEDISLRKTFNKMEAPKQII